MSFNMLRTLGSASLPQFPNLLPIPFPVDRRSPTSCLDADMSTLVNTVCSYPWEFSLQGRRSREGHFRVKLSSS